MQNSQDYKADCIRLEAMLDARFRRDNRYWDGIRKWQEIESAVILDWPGKPISQQ